MDTSRLHPELRSAYRLVPHPPIGALWRIRAIRKVIGLLPAIEIPDGFRFETIDFAPGVGVRVTTPPGGGNGGALLFIHGGGMVIGSAAMEDARCLKLARELNIVAVSIEHRLAPEHPFPAPLDDCYQAWEWIQREAASRGIDPHRVAIGGESAGGGLAAGLVQRLRDTSDVQPVAQWLYCPMLDDRTAARIELDPLDHFLWNNRTNLIGWTAYLGEAPGGKQVPDYASPARRTDLTGLPPTRIAVGDIDLFFEENRAYAEDLRAAGVDSTFYVVPGAPHAFDTVCAKTDVAKKYTASSFEWLREHLS